MPIKNYRPWDPDGVYLFPPSPREWLPENHLAHFVLEVVAELDLSAIESVLQAKDPRGVVPYSPRMMVALLLYGYARGVYSSRRLARATYEDVAMRLITAGNHPHFSTISDFRQDHLAALSALFVQALRMCATAGLVKLGHVSLDGTKIQANASKHSAMSYERMQADEKRLADEVTTLLAKARAKDEEEDEQLGKGQDEMDIPAELARREKRLLAIRAARKALEEESALARAAELRELAKGNDARVSDGEDPTQAKAAATRAANQRKQADELDPPKDGPGDDSSSGGSSGPTVPVHTPDHDASGKPTPKAQRNFTDPDSRIMKKGSEYVQAYNAQAAVDADSHVIVAQDLSNQAPDAEYLPPVMQSIEKNLGRKPEKGSADAGYWSEANAAWCEEQGIDAYIATRRERHAEQGSEVKPSDASASAELQPETHTGAAPSGADADDHRGADEKSAAADGAPDLASEGATPPEAPSPPSPCATSEPEPPLAPKPPSRREKMRQKLKTPEGRAVYRLRKCTPEPVFGNIKEARGFRRFLLRGMEKVRHEWGLICTVHNLLKLYGARLAM